MTKKVNKKRDREGFPKENWYPFKNFVFVRIPG